jgi:hypothetical protein
MVELSMTFITSPLSLRAHSLVQNCFAALTNDKEMERERVRERGRGTTSYRTKMRQNVTAISRRIFNTAIHITIKFVVSRTVTFQKGLILINFNTIWWY